MASALYTDVKKLNSNFIRPCEGQFGLVEWIVQGIPIEVSASVANLPQVLRLLHLEAKRLQVKSRMPVSH